MKPIPFFDFETVHQVSDNLIGIDVPTELVQGAFRRQRTRQDFQTLAPRIGAEIVRSGNRTSLLDKNVGENNEGSACTENIVVSLYDLGCGRNPLASPVVGNRRTNPTGGGWV